MKTPLKHRLYNGLWIILGFLFGILAGGIVVLSVILFSKADINIHIIYIPAVLAGIVFGLWAGPVAWRKIYIEGIRGKQYIAK